MDLLERIHLTLKGRVAMRPGEVELLADTLAKCPGNHVEIGTLWGGSTVLALLSKPGGHIYAIDPLIGFYGSSDHLAGGKIPTADDVLANFERFGAGGRITMIKAMSHPWPLHQSIIPETVLIDGDHTFEGCLDDWQNVKDITTKYVIFHDCQHEAFTGITRVVDEFVASDPNWHQVDCVKTLIVFERVI